MKRMCVVRLVERFPNFGRIDRDAVLLGELDNSLFLDVPLVDQNVVEAVFSFVAR